MSNPLFIGVEEQIPIERGSGFLTPGVYNFDQLVDISCDDQKCVGSLPSGVYNLNQLLYISCDDQKCAGYIRRGTCNWRIKIIKADHPTTYQNFKAFCESSTVFRFKN